MTVGGRAQWAPDCLLSWRFADGRDLRPCSPRRNGSHHGQMVDGAGERDADAARDTARLWRVLAEAAQARQNAR